MCQIKLASNQLHIVSRSNVLRSETHTHLTDCSTWTTKVVSKNCQNTDVTTTTTTTGLRPFFRDHPGEPVPEENFWILWCKGRLTEADTPTIQPGATPSGLTSAHLHHLPIFFTGQMPFLPPNLHRQSTEGN